MNVLGICGGAVFGGLFFYWISGPRVIDVAEFEWLMKLDWRINFLGWHLFRNDPWRIPPGTIEGYLAGEGTTIGFTDSVPLAALLLKPFDPLLPTPFQYFGLWLLACFVLQGAFGALITRVYTSNVGLQIAGGALFVLMPTLLMRVGHPALTAHFVLLWALWMYLRSSADRSPRTALQVLLGFVVGLIHPYLAAMTLALLVAIPLRDRTVRSLIDLAAALVATVCAWWLAGFISVGSTTDLAGGGLGLYSMNLLSPITPRGWSTLLPDWPVANEMQAYEGFQYVGAGVMLVVLAAAVTHLAGRSPHWQRAWPVTAICIASALYAVSPRVTLGDSVLVDFTSPALDRWAFFRASGRFFWPMTYLVLSAAISVLAARLRTALAIAVLVSAVALQFIDQRNAHEERRTTSRSDAFHLWARQLSPAWSDVLPHYRQILIAPATQCGGAPIEHEELAYLAGLHELTINSGLGARWDDEARRRYCGSLDVAMSSGRLDDDAIYIVSPAYEQRLRGAGGSVVCGSLDAARICVTEKSYEAWRHAVPLSD
jgi:hypothetical protein